MHNLKINEVENYLNRILDLKLELIDKDFRISMLEFELTLEKQLLESIKKIYIPAEKSVK